MEKNKNRTDLLAAGRKKLQQFRQKKDGKGNSSKLSGKGGKSGRGVVGGTAAEAAVTQQNAPDGEVSELDTNEHDATMGASTDEAVAQQHDSDLDRVKHGAEDNTAVPESESRVDSVASVTASSKSGHVPTTASTGEATLVQGGEKYNHDADDTIALSESASRGDAVASDSASVNDEPSAKADTGTTHVSKAAEYPSEGSGVDYPNQTAVGGHDVCSRVDQEERPSSLVLEDATNNVPETVLEQRPEDTSLSLPTDVSSVQAEHGEEQVTDVGAMQEFGSSSGYQISDGMVRLLDGDSNPPLTDTLESTGDGRETDSGNTLEEKKIHGAAHLSKIDNVPSTVSISDYAGEGQERENTSFGSSEEKAGVVNASGGNVYIEGTQASSGFVEVERSLEFESNEGAKSLACKEIDLSSILDGSVVKLSQLADILKVLDDDEFRCLFMSRESSLASSRDADKIKADDYAVHNSFERLKEHLYVTCLSKDAFQLQLSEHQKWINEISATNSSLAKVQGENGTLSKEILLCRDDIAKVVSEKVELEKQLQSSTAEAEGFAAKVNELQSKLDMTHEEMSGIFSELVECRNMVNALQSENENLNENLNVMTEEKNKFWEERGKVLLENEKLAEELNQHKASLESLHTLLQDDRKQLEQQNYSLNCENSKLCADLTEYTNTVEALKVENKNLNEKLSSLSEERTKLEKEKTLVDNQIKEMSEEMIDYKDLSATLQTEIINLNKHIISIAEEKRNLAEENNTIFSDYEKQTCELVEFKVLETVLQTECFSAIDDLKEARIHIRRLTEENESLNADADSAGKDMSKYDLLKDHDDRIQEANIELMVLYETMGGLTRHAVARESELLGLRDALENQVAALKSENSHLREKINGFQALVNELQGHSEGLCRDSDEMVASISNQLQALQAEVADRESVLEEECRSVYAEILQTVGILDYAAKNISANSLPGGNGTHNVVSSVAASVDGACKVIEGLRRQLDTAQSDYQEMSHKSDVALMILHRLYHELSELVTSFGYYPAEADNADDRSIDLLRPDFFDTLLDQLKKLSGERLQLESASKQLGTKLSKTASETEELHKLCLKSDTVFKLIDEIAQLVKLEGTAMYADEPASVLESIIRLLVDKYKEANQGLSLCAPLETQVHDLLCQVEHLNFVIMERENENLIFKHSLKSAQEVVIASNSKIQEKVTELEQSEQRVSSLREKLSIAVTKGKGLISQRESLKQSLAETSKELEKCSQELLSKDARLHELEAKVKVYSEAGERMEALESELSYIRNSATALRESFLLKDSVLQRIEEILDDLELPEHFHSRDIIEKTDWLAKLVGSHSLPLGEWDQRSSAGGGSYSDAGFVGPDGLKEDMQPNSNLSEDLRRRYEELENRFYGLAEQNEMLEQSLMERNNLVQRWEEILNRVDMPSQLRSMEPEDKIQWLGTALSEAQNYSYSLQEKIDNFETLRVSLIADLEDSQRRTSELETAFNKACTEKESLLKDLEILRQDNETLRVSLIADLEDSQRGASELETAFHKACTEKESLLKDLEILRQDNDDSVKRIDDITSQNENLQNEASMIQAQKLQLEEDRGRIEDAIRRMQEMVDDALQDSCPEDMALGQGGVGFFEEILRKLVGNYKELLSKKPADVDSTDVTVTEKGELGRTSRDFEEQDAAIATLSKNLEDCMGEIMCLKEEKDRHMLTNQSLLHELEEQKLKKTELEELFNQEEHKSASLREKLNVAVRKGKSLVQQRDGMKQVIAELNTEVERLKSEAKHTEKTILEYEEQVKNLLTAHDRVQVVESENSFLRDRLAETESYLQEKVGSWTSILNALGEIDIGLGTISGDPVERIRDIGKYLYDLHGRLDSLEQESRKSKRAAELLLAELNEVQERNDVLQDELAKSVNELSEVSREKSLAENAKYEALAHLEKLSYLHSEEKERHMSEIMALESGVDRMRNDLNTIERELGDALSKDLEVLCNLNVVFTSILDLDSPPALNDLFHGSFAGGIVPTKSENKVFMTQIDSIRERIHKHSSLLQEETSRLSEAAVNARREYTSQNEFYESLKRDIQRLQSIEKERESELHVLQGNILLLYETCASAISSLENWKEHGAGNVMASRPPQRNFSSESKIGGNGLTGDVRTFNEESIRSICDKLLLVVGDSISMQTVELARVVEVGQSEMKSTIMNLQKELQDKDIQRERICKELVDQIKEAETNAKNYLLDLQQATVKLHDSQRQLDLISEEHKLMEQRMKELHDKESNSIHLQQKVASLTDALAAKVQECEALMQALDEQEAEMENLANKIVGLENELQQKNKDSENLEASRAKALKKLSVTVSKFDELHSLSENLLSEVEKLQSQLQEKDGEISFLRQEVTRCTNDALAVTQMSKKSSDEIQDLLSWVDSLISRVQARDVASDSKTHLVNEYKDVLQKRILDLISELENLRETTQNRDMLLQEERFKVEEMTQKEQHLKNSLREMESQLAVLQGVGDSAKATKPASEIVEVEPMTNKWASSGPIAPQVRSLRKPNNDQVAIAIDMDDSGQRLEDDDDDKAHGFKSLTTSKIVPRFTRPVSDMVDGLWVSCDRALMRQPALRLGVIIYWAVLHAMLATFVV